MFPDLRADAGAPGALQRAGLPLGPACAALLLLVLPSQYTDAAGEIAAFSRDGHVTAALLIWMAIWWMTETVDLAVTALLPLVVLPLGTTTSIEQAAAPYARPEIYLFLGGFLMAMAMQRWQLDRRIALLTLSAVGTRPPAMIGGCMIATAVLSAFVSNTATAAMMLPIAISIIALFDQSGSDREGQSAFAKALLLSVAYAASIGGIATIIGSPPNVFLVGYLRSGIAPEYRMDISFAQWMIIGVPITLVMLPVAWFLLVRVIYRVPRAPIPGGSALLRSRIRDLGPLRRPELLTLIVFASAAALWITRQPLTSITIGSGAEAVRPFSGLTDAGIAMIAAMILFLLPANKTTRVLDWETARRAPFGILILFGGGLSLAGAIQHNGVTEFIAAHAVLLGGWPVIAVILVITLLIIFLTEVTSNTATVTTLVPILAAMAPVLGASPIEIIVPATVAASCAFMMPVATPPNAIVFAAGRLRIADMCRAGFLLNLIGVIVVAVLAGTLAVRFIE